MRIFKTRLFNQWAKKVPLLDEALKQAIEEISLGQYEAHLGGFLVKKRIAIGGRGKRSSLRTIIVFKKGSKAFFVYGYAKNVKANIGQKEKEVYKKLGQILLGYNDEQLEYAVKQKEIFEVL